MVEVWLKAAVDRTQGRTWPRHSDGRPLDITTFEDPEMLLVHLPSGKMVKLSGRAFTLHQEKGFVTTITALPLNDLVSFPDAVAAARNVWQRVAGPSPAADTILREWAAISPAPAPDLFGKKFVVRESIEAGVTLSLEIKPHASAAGWFISAEIDAPAT